CRVLSSFSVKIIFSSYSPESAAMVGPLAIAMVFIGLMQAMGMWSLDSRWFEVAMAYGVLGVGDWVALLIWGKSPGAMLCLMPVAAACAFGLLFILWLTTMRNRHRFEGDRTEKLEH